MRYCFVLSCFLFASIAHADGPVRIGSCNVAKVFEGLDERKAIEMNMKSNAATHNAEVAKRRKAIEELSGQRDELRPDSPLYQQKTDELVTAATQLDVMMKLKEMELARLEKQHVAHLYDEIRAACKVAAAAHKLDLVVAERPGETGREMGKMSGEQLKLMLSLNEVLFANQEVDLTEEVVMGMNKEFAAKK